MKTELLTTIGLEIHVELKTSTKLFCGCMVAFGGEPNTRVCPVCLGHPGTLPVPNERAVEFAMKIALALGCELAPRSIFHRKNYFYPDMPKNYQISQYDIPIGSAGALDIEVGEERRTIGITRVHLEEDTGKSIHVGGGGRIHEADYSLEDFNRAGTPLVEIVTEPDLGSPEEARVFASELRAILELLDVSDVRMEEGSMRVDANISVGPAGERGVKAEIKNMNSLRSVYRALGYEQKRQGDLIAQGQLMEQSTRHWDEKAGKTSPLRTKEYAFDYRYFPEPDLVPIEPSVEWLRQLREEIPELPAERRSRFMSEYALGPDEAATLTSSPDVADFFEAAARAKSGSEPKQIANWIANDLAGRLTERGETISEARLSPEGLADLVGLIGEQAISHSQAKLLLGEMLETGRGARELADEKGLSQMADSSELEGVVDQVIADNPDVIAKVRSGNSKSFGFLMGQVIRATGGRANAKLAEELLKQKL